MQLWNYYKSIKMSFPPRPNIVEMTEMLSTMSQEQRDHIFIHLKGKIPGLEQAYKASNTIDRYASLFKKSDKT